MKIIDQQSVIMLTFQTGLLTFNEANLRNLIKEKNITESQRSANGLTFNVYSTNDLTFVIDGPQNIIRFTILGKISCSEQMNEIQEILQHLNFSLGAQVALGFQCTTVISVDESEQVQLLNRLAPFDMNKIKLALNSDNIWVNGIMFKTHSNTSDTEITIQPNIPNKMINFIIASRFTSHEDFSIFINQFSLTYVESVVNEIFGISS